MGNVSGKEFLEKVLEAGSPSPQFTGRWLPNTKKIKKLIRRFEDAQTSFGFRIDLAVFAIMYGLKDDENAAEEVFKIWARNEGHCDVLTVISASLICANGPWNDKMNMLFEFFDMDLNDSLSKDELTIMVKACAQGLSILMDLQPPSLGDIEAISSACFAMADVGGEDFEEGSKDQKIEKNEFLRWMATDRSMNRLLAAFTPDTPKLKKRNPSKGSPKKKNNPKPGAAAAAATKKPLTRPKNLHERNDVKKIRAKFRKDHILIIRKVFDDLDKDGSGGVSPKEIAVGFKNEGLEQMFNSEQQASLTFRQVLSIVYRDATDKELEIMVGWTKTKKIPKAVIVRLKEIFDCWDLDCTSKASLRKLLAVCAPSVKLNKYVKVMPLNPNTPDRHVTLLEFLKYIFAGVPSSQMQEYCRMVQPLKPLSQDQRKELSGLFAIYDTNNDGSIDYDEFREAVKGVSDQEMERLLAQFEYNKAHCISFSQFLQLYRSIWQQHESDGLSSVLKSCASMSAS